MAFNEQWVNEIIRDYPTGKGHTALDIGANQGKYTVVMSNVFDFVHAIEAHPQTAKQTVEAMTERGLTNVKVHNLAISDKDRPTKLYFTGKDGTNAGGNSISHKVANEQRWGHRPSKFIEVPGMTIDTFVKKNKIKNLRFIKMDIEGGEDTAWYGALETLENTKLDIILEVHNTVDCIKLFRFFKDFRFKIFASNGQPVDKFVHDTHYLLTNRV